MDDAPKKSRSEESFHMGALAVEQSDTETSSRPADMHSQLGKMAVSNSDLTKLLEPGEQVVTIVRRHPIGIIGIYIEMFAGVIILGVLMVLALSGTFGKLPTSTEAAVGLGGVLVAGFLVLILLISIHVYRQSRLMVADRSLVSIVQNALFSKKIARLSMANVEDVTCDQKGILQSILNYGTLTIQTAGQEDNFIFPFCPNPNKTADQILEARQAFVRKAD